MQNYKPSPVEIERRKRIKVCLAAYAYEILHVSIITDAAFDKLCLEIRPKLCTGHNLMDKFFKEQFDSSTGLWIHKHPELDGIKKIYNKVFAVTSKI